MRWFICCGDIPRRRRGALHDRLEV